MKKYIFIVLIATTIASTIVHKFFVSVTQIDYVEDKNALQITTKLFIDDIESLIRERYDDTITLAEKNESSQIDFFVERYINEKLKININGEQLVLNFLGREYEDDIMICYLEVENITTIKNLEIENTIFFDLFEDQQNIVRTKINGKQKSFILIKENAKGMLNFN